MNEVQELKAEKQFQHREFTKDVQLLEERCRALESKIISMDEQCEGQLSRRRAEIEVMKRDYDSLLESTHQKDFELEKVRREMVDTVNSCEDEKRRMRDDLDALNTQQSEMRVVRDEANRLLLVISEKDAKMQAMIEEKRDFVVSIDNEKSKIKDTVIGLTSRITEQEAELQSLRSEVSRLTISNSKKDNEIKVMKDEKTAFEDERTLARGQADTLTAISEQQRLEMETAQEEVQLLRTLNTAKDASIRAMKDEVDTLASFKDKRESEVQLLRAEMGKLISHNDEKVLCLSNELSAQTSLYHQSFDKIKQMEIYASELEERFNKMSEDDESREAEANTARWGFVLCMLVWVVSLVFAFHEGASGVLVRQIIDYVQR